MNKLPTAAEVRGLSEKFMTHNAAYGLSLDVRATALIGDLLLQFAELLSDREEFSIKSLDCYAVGADLRLNPECCQLFLDRKQAEEYRRTWNPEGGWKIWSIEILESES